MAFADRMVVRRCTCGRLDLRERWLSARTAEYVGAWQRPWTCGFCGRSSFTLVVPGSDQAEHKLPMLQPDDRLIVGEEDLLLEGQIDAAMPAELPNEVDSELARQWRAQRVRARVGQLMRCVRMVFHQRGTGPLRRA